MPFQSTDPEFSHYTDTDSPGFGIAQVRGTENKEQYRARIYAANRALDLHDLEMQLFGETYDGRWALRGRYSENKLAELKAEATANVLANPEYDDEYPLNAFYNDCGFEDVEWFFSETEPLDSAWGYQRQYFEWCDPFDSPYNDEITWLCSTCDEYTAAMEAQ